jgi:hypothetical protein
MINSNVSAIGQPCVSFDDCEVTADLFNDGGPDHGRATVLEHNSHWIEKGHAGMLDRLHEPVDLSIFPFPYVTHHHQQALNRDVIE